MDGTLYLGEQLFEGTADFLAWVRENGGHYAFLTNNSSRGIEGYLAKMQRMGIPQSPDDFLTSADATIDYLKKTYQGCDDTGAPDRITFYVCGTENLKGQLRAAGLKVLTEAELAEQLDEILELAENEKGLQAAESHDAVTLLRNDGHIPVLLLGYDTELTYEKLENSVKLLNLGADYIATHPDLVCPVEYGYVPDIGLVIHALKVCTGREPLVIGKPQPQMVFTALEKYGVSAEETVLIGDRLYTDIACGNNAGIDTILVLSGEGTIEDCEKYGVHPTWIYPDIAAVLKALKLGEI